MKNEAFVPMDQSTITVAVTDTSSAATALTSDSAESILITNAGSDIMFVRFGDSGMGAATTASMPISGTSAQVVERPDGASHIRVICDTGGSTTAYFSQGRGL